MKQTLQTHTILINVNGPKDRDELPCNSSLGTFTSMQCLFDLYCASELFKTVTNYLVIQFVFRYIYKYAVSV